jgi:hypothetical protein
MMIEINKDIEKIKENVFFGLTAKQSISALLSLIVGSAVVLLLQNYIGLVASAYVAVPAVAPIALGGFYSYNGMSFFELWRRRIRFMFFNRPLLYVSTEDEDRAEKAKKEILKKTKDEAGLYGLKKRKGTNKMIKTVIICIVVTTMAVLYWALYGKGALR